MEKLVNDIDTLILRKKEKLSEKRHPKTYFKKILQLMFLGFLIGVLASPLLLNDLGNGAIMVGCIFSVCTGLSVEVFNFIMQNDWKIRLFQRISTAFFCVCGYLLYILLIGIK